MPAVDGSPVGGIMWTQFLAEPSRVFSREVQRFPPPTCRSLTATQPAQVAPQKQLPQTQGGARWGPMVVACSLRPFPPE